MSDRLPAPWFALYCLFGGSVGAGRVLIRSLSSEMRLDTIVDICKDRNMLFSCTHSKILRVPCSLVIPVCFMRCGPGWLCSEGVLAASQPLTRKS